MLLFCLLIYSILFFLTCSEKEVLRQTRASEKEYRETKQEQVRKKRIEYIRRDKTRASEKEEDDILDKTRAEYI